jgi:hypothetical protein
MPMPLGFLMSAARGGASSASAPDGPPGVPGMPLGFQPLAFASGIPARSGGASSETLERMQRLSSAVAGSIFSDLINGALRPGDAGPPPASQQAIEKLERNVCCDAGASCPICLCELAAAGEGATQMPCKHVFHDSCLTKWLRSHNTCPVCRATVEADETARPSSLSALLHGWREHRLRNDAADGGGGAARSGSSDAVGNATADAPPARQATLTRMEPPLSESELERMSVGELKRRLTVLGVDFAGIVEKRELQELLRRHTRSSSRLHVQLHMEVLQLPAGTTGAQAFEAAARAAAAAAATSSNATSASTTSAETYTAAPPARARDSVATESTAASASAPPRASRRRRREHVPGELREPSTRSTRPRRS